MSLAFNILLGVVGAVLVATGLVHIAKPTAMAAQLGWEPAPPFQQVVGTWNLAIGALALAAPWASDGFRRPVAIAAAVFWIGAAIIHLCQLAHRTELRRPTSVPTAAIEALIGIGLAVGVATIN